MSFRSSSGTQSRRPMRYVYELPYYERNELCLCLDVNNKWKELGGKFLGFDYRTMNRFEMAAVHRSPTDTLLGEWGSQNGTILKLFEYLYKMRNYQAMKILKPFVDPQYHRYIRDQDDDPTFSSGSEYSLGNHPSPSNPPNPSNRSRVSVRQNPAATPATSQSSQQRSGSGSGDTPATLETDLTRLSLDACSLHISYNELQVATRNWDRRLTLGKGGFGVVYKGSWKNTAVAVKRLESQRPNDPHYNAAEVQRQQSLRELKYLNNYKHDNILPLYGYSIDGEKPCLVYQFMSNGSLEDRLQCRQDTRALSWWQRVTIANGSARGLQFLHSMAVPLIHGDIKSANILLDSNFIPKIGDFGLAKEGPVKDITHVEITKVQGTKPYLPIEFLRGRKLSVKVDTYGFGVVLCELATGLKAYDDSRKDRFLRDHCHEAENNFLINLKDSKAGPEEDYFYILLIKLGIQCTNNTARNRPFMADVLREIDNMMENRRLLMDRITATHTDRRSSLPPVSYSNLLPQFLYPSPPASKQPVLSTSPSPPSHLPQVMEITKECGSTVYEQRRISPVRVTPPMSTLNPTHEPMPSHSPPDKKSEVQVPPQINVQPSTPQPGGDTEPTYGNSVTSTASTIDNDDDESENGSETEIPIPIVPELEN